MSKSGQQPSKADVGGQRDEESGKGGHSKQQGAKMPPAGEEPPLKPKTS